MNLIKKHLSVLLHTLLLVGLFFPVISYAQQEPSTQTVGSTSPGNNSFVPLTQLPGLSDTADSTTLPAFLNQLYKICIGAAAVIAVIEIMIAGVQFMTSRGSVSSNEAAKSRIQNAVLGLVLVLSPTIVFGIINPDILKLNLDFSELKPKDLQDVDTNAVQSGTLPKCGSPEAEASKSAAGTPAACDNSGGGVSTVTGTLIKTGVFSSEAALYKFINECPVTAKSTMIGNIAAEGGKASSKGCTKTCTPAGQGSCDARGCLQYTAYCSVQSSATIYLDTKKPIPQDEYKWTQFASACQTAGGVPQDTYSTGNAQTCYGANDVPTKCVTATLSCNPK